MARSRHSSTPPLGKIERRSNGSYSFLATTPIDEVMEGCPRRVVPLLGFEWGFDVRPEVAPIVEMRAVSSIGSNEWAALLPILRAEYPSPLWTFADAM
jgi:hypothetical protein